MKVTDHARRELNHLGEKAQSASVSVEVSDLIDGFKLWATARLERIDEGTGLIEEDREEALLLARTAQEMRGAVAEEHDQGKLARWLRAKIMEVSAPKKKS